MVSCFPRNLFTHISNIFTSMEYTGSKQAFSAAFSFIKVPRFWNQWQACDMRTNKEENGWKRKVLRMFTILVSFCRPENHGAIWITSSSRAEQTCYGNMNQTRRVSNLNKSVANFYNYCFSLVIREHFLWAFGKKEAFKGLILHRHTDYRDSLLFG